MFSNLSVSGKIAFHKAELVEVFKIYRIWRRQKTVLVWLFNLFYNKRKRKSKRQSRRMVNSEVKTMWCTRHRAKINNTKT